ncbi:hypothetical protein IscW_ISCW008958 [Ixodes scapularis]|uniref:Uncharacterized protein n=1 Tax=Ixodes scapularis TaxID=6945 RepID=B7PXD0_IXOSC|nr:hypothetical protein IscW_ISCW008958 [Ixodes scapularis]|eukprot:XP_002400182.1 hypothetical protein IscW_ISCW008958 [Ixodes scapularis]
MNEVCIREMDAAASCKASPRLLGLQIFLSMGLKKLIKWALLCRHKKMHSQKSQLHFVSGKMYSGGNRETRYALRNTSLGGTF